METKPFICALTDPQRASIHQRVAIVVAHPDDEVIGLGGQLSRFEHLLFIHVTNGAPVNMRDARALGFPDPESYAAERRREFEAALKVARLYPGETQCLGIPDQEAAFCLVEIVHELKSQFRQFRPEVIITHPYEGGHPDHDACAFSVHVACRNRGCGVVEMTSYHRKGGRFVTGAFLPSHHPVSMATVLLGPAEQATKQKLFSCYRTQQKVLKAFPIHRERFRTAPAYDFTKPPRCDQLYYESQNWGISGRTFRHLVRQAQGMME